VLNLPAISKAPPAFVPWVNLPVIFVIWICSGVFAHVEGHRAPEIAELVLAGLSREVWRAPVLPVDGLRVLFFAVTVLSIQRCRMKAHTRPGMAWHSATGEACRAHLQCPRFRPQGHTLPEPVAVTSDWFCRMACNRYSLKLNCLKFTACPRACKLTAA